MLEVIQKNNSDIEAKFNKERENLPDIHKRVLDEQLQHLSRLGIINHHHYHYH